MQRPYEIIELESCTVFWKELGVDIHNTAMNTKAANKWDEIEIWLEENIKEKTYNPHYSGIWFLHKEDAILFKLTWAGRIV
jgi:hypothetical protein